MNHLAELDRVIGPVAVLDLDHRGLIAAPGPAGADVVVADGIADRVTAALAGVHSKGTLAWAEALLAHGRGAAPEFARPGDRPWHAMAPASFGNRALLRTVADGLVWATDPEWRPVSAGLGAVVTHAHPRAVAGSVAVAEITARLVADPSLASDVPALAASVADQVEALDSELASRLRQLPAPGAPAGRTVHETLPAVLASLAAPGAPGPRREHSVAFRLLAALAGAAGLRSRRAPASVRDLGRRISARLVGDAVLTGPSGDEPVHTWFLLDRSGSMEALHAPVVDGFNEFVTSQQAKPGADLRLTAVQFDDADPHEVVFGGLPVAEVLPLRYDQFQPRGMTPLYDAMGLIIGAAERDVAARARAGLPEEDVVVVVMTDGMENASHEWTHTSIFDLVAAKQAEGWTFVFLGANQDSYATGAHVGVASGNTSNFAASPAGMGQAWSSVDRSVASYRGKPRSRRLAQREDFFEGVKEAESTPPPKSRR